LDQHIEVIRVDVEVLLLDLDHVLDFLVLRGDLGEAVSEPFDLRPDLGLFLLGDL